MSNEPSDRSDQESNQPTFDDWLEQKAAETGSSRERVLEQLLGSYWKLKEITQLVDERVQPQLSTDGDEATGAHMRQDGGNTDETVSKTEVAELLDHVEALETELRTESQRRAGLTEEVHSLAAEFDEFEAGIDTVTELSNSIDAVTSSLEAEQERLNDRLDDEFENLQTILDYLVQTGDDLDARITETQTQFRAEIRELRTEREQLRRLRQEARDLGTHHANCEQCGESMDVALLTIPDCPNCNQLLTGVKKETKWLFLSTYTATTGNSAQSSASDDTDTSHGKRPSSHRDAESPPSDGEDNGSQPDTEQTGTPVESTSLNESDFEWLS